MCAVSAVSEHYLDRYKIPQYFPAYSPTQTPVVPLTIEQIKQAVFEWDEFKKLREAAERYDRAVGEPDCVDEEKDKRIKELEEKLEELRKLLDE